MTATDPEYNKEERHLFQFLKVCLEPNEYEKALKLTVVKAGKRYPDIMKYGPNGENVAKALRDVGRYFLSPEVMSDTDKNQLFCSYLEEREKHFPLFDPPYSLASRYSSDLLLFRFRNKLMEAVNDYVANYGAPGWTYTVVFEEFISQWLCVLAWHGMMQVIEMPWEAEYTHINMLMTSIMEVPEDTYLFA